MVYVKVLMCVYALAVKERVCEQCYDLSSQFLASLNGLKIHRDSNARFVRKCPWPVGAFFELPNVLSDLILQKNRGID